MSTTTTTNAVQNGLQLYLKQINDSKLLTADEEKALARKIIHENDFEAASAWSAPTSASW